MVLSPLFYSFLFLVLSVLSSCQDANAIADTNQAINNRTWSYVNKVRVPVTIDEKKRLTIMFLINLRHTGDYKYSNIFLLIHSRRPAER